MASKLKDLKGEGMTSRNLDQILNDYRTACVSREMSLLLRKEVLSGKAKFGIGGAGKEIPLIALAKTFMKGDFWSGYYRDQTAMLAKEILSPVSFFSALYGDADNDSFSGGRQMNNHYATPLVDEEGMWTKHADQYNVTSGMASLASNVPRALGTALATKAYAENEFLSGLTDFSRTANEVSFCIVGDATTSEGVFFEGVNAAGVMQIPIAFIVLDDGYGISVPSKYQTTKGNISEVLKGFAPENGKPGVDIYTEKAWKYEKLLSLFETGIDKVRKEGTPAIFHITECTQPQGHSTSGSHQRYKSKERLDWESDNDCIAKMKKWILKHFQVEIEVLDDIEKKAVSEVRAAKNEAWKLYQDPIITQKKLLTGVLEDLIQKYPHYDFLPSYKQRLVQHANSDRSELVSFAENIRFHFSTKEIETADLSSWLEANQHVLELQYNTNLLHSGSRSALNVPVEHPIFDENEKEVSGYQVLNKYFDQLLKKDPRVYAFGEDVGKIGDVNQAFSGLQDKYGEHRVFDTGIREWTIIGQGIGMAMRGLRPIAEIQYLDYLSYAFSALNDDLATLHYRSNGQQSAPLIVRTRGHRLEGIWHSGSPMGMLLSSMRGIHICTPRNMTQAAGMYNTLLQSNDPAIVIECLNGYRIKELPPENLGTFTVPLGVPEVLIEGEDVTVVTYGSTLRLVSETVERLVSYGVNAELIDVQTLLPFDLEKRILTSIRKTNKVIFIDEDVPGGATAFMMQEVLENQGAYYYLDAPPLTLTAKQHRPAYGNNGDYVSKPNKEQIFKAIYNLTRESETI